MSNLKIINAIRNGGNVERFHTTKMICRQNVAQHSFNAALLGHHIACVYLNGLPSANVDPNTISLHMLLHDISEQATGDVPSYTKKHYPSLKAILDNAEQAWAKNNLSADMAYGYDKDNLTIEERIICKFVDQYECAMTCLEEIAMGNSGFTEIYGRCVTGALFTMEMANNIPSLYGVLSDMMGELPDV